MCLLRVELCTRRLTLGVASFIIGRRDNSVCHRCAGGQRRRLDYYLGGSLGRHISKCSPRVSMA